MEADVDSGLLQSPGSEPHSVRHVRLRAVQVCEAAPFRIWGCFTPPITTGQIVCKAALQQPWSKSGKDVTSATLPKKQRRIEQPPLSDTCWTWCLKQTQRSTHSQGVVAARSEASVVRAWQNQSLLDQYRSSALRPHLGSRLYQHLGPLNKLPG